MEALRSTRLSTILIPEQGLQTYIGIDAVMTACTYNIDLCVCVWSATCISLSVLMPLGQCVWEAWNVCVWVHVCVCNCVFRCTCLCMSVYYLLKPLKIVLLLCVYSPSLLKKSFVAHHNHRFCNMSRWRAITILDFYSITQSRPDRNIS